MFQILDDSSKIGDLVQNSMFDGNATIDLKTSLILLWQRNQLILLVLHKLQLKV